MIPILTSTTMYLSRTAAVQAFEQGAVFIFNDITSPSHETPVNIKGLCDAGYTRIKIQYGRDRKIVRYSLEDGRIVLKRRKAPQAQRGNDAHDVKYSKFVAKYKNDEEFRDQVDTWLEDSPPPEEGEGDELEWAFTEMPVDKFPWMLLGAAAAVLVAKKLWAAPSAKGHPPGGQQAPAPAADVPALVEPKEVAGLVAEGNAVSALEKYTL